MNTKRLLPFAVLALLLLAGFAVYWLSDLGDKSGKQPGPGQQPAPQRTTDSQPAQAHATTTRKTERTGAAPMKHAADEADEDEPIIAFGVLEKPAGLDLLGLEVVVNNALGEQVASAEIDADGKFEVHYGRTLVAGWNVAATWAQVKARAASAPEVERYAPAVVPNLPYHPKGSAAVECRLQVVPQPTISGHVVDRATGEPIAGATVTAASTLAPWRDVPEEEVTDDEGLFSIAVSDLPLQDVIVWVKADEHQAALSGPFTLTAGEKKSITFDLTGAVTARGRVVEEGSGKPIAGAEVYVVGRDFAVAQDHAIEATGPDGAFEVDCSNTPLERVRIKVHAQGYASADAVVTDVASLGEIKLGKPVVLRGKLKPSKSEPLPKIEVMVAGPDEWTWNDPMFYDSEFIGSDGTFSITLANAAVNDAVLYIDCDPYAPVKLPLAAAQARSSNDTTRDVEIALHAEGAFMPVSIVLPTTRPVLPGKTPIPAKK